MHVLNWCRCAVSGSCPLLAVGCVRGHAHMDMACDSCRYVYQTLRNSRHAVSTIDEADVIYVYDYCYLMWILSDHHARQHWWLRSNYQPELKTGSYLLSSYR